MITTLTGLREMMLTTADSKAQAQSRTSQQVQNQEHADPAGLSPAKEQSAPQDAVSVELSVSHDVFSAVDDFFNLGKSGRFDAFHALAPKDKEQFVKIVAELAKSGYVGYEELIINKKVERHEVTAQIADRRAQQAKVYDNSKPYRR